MFSGLHKRVGAAGEAVVLTEPAAGLTDLWTSALHAPGSLQQAKELKYQAMSMPDPHNVP